MIKKVQFQNSRKDQASNMYTSQHLQLDISSNSNLEYKPRQHALKRVDSHMTSPDITFYQCYKLFFKKKILSKLLEGQD